MQAKSWHYSALADTHTHTHFLSLLARLHARRLTLYLSHIFLWFVIIDQLLNVLGESDCYDGPREWKQPLQIVVYDPCILFTLFAVVPVVQLSQMNAKSTHALFLNASIAYAILSVTAKTLLGATYVAFVVLFPFKTEV